LNREERDRIVLKNLPLVGYLASEAAAKATALSREDLASVGTIALISCAENFDATLGVPFGAYARIRINGAFADEMRSQDWAPRIARRRIKETSAIRETLTAALGRCPTVPELADAMGVEKSEVHLALSDASRQTSRLDDTDAETIVTALNTPEEAVLIAEQSLFVHECIDTLPENLRDIIRAVYFEDKSIKQLAEERGVTHSAVSHKRSEAIKMLRVAMGSHYSTIVPDNDESPERANAPRRTAYLSEVAERTVGGIARYARNHSSVIVTA
jgi:RNA polymerase sigma factor for flagellar operon FliA